MFYYHHSEKDFEDKRIWKGNAALHIAYQEGHLPVVQYLIEKGANIEVKDWEQKTPLHIACLRGYLPIVQYFIEKGANIEAKEIDQQTSLHVISY